MFDNLRGPPLGPKQTLILSCPIAFFLIFLLLHPVLSLLRFEKVFFHQKRKWDWFLLSKSNAARKVLTAEVS